MKALVVVDVQNDFLPGGALPVQGGFEVVEPILALAQDADVIAKTGDLHPPQSNHFDKWPVHCVRGTRGAELLAAIEGLPGPVFYKGTHEDEDGYSGFDGTALEGSLWEFKDKGEVIVVGLALDHCVKATALDAKRLGFDTTVHLPATRAVDFDTGTEAVKELRLAGVKVTAR